MTKKNQKRNSARYTDEYLTMLLRKTEIVIWKFKRHKKNNKNGKKQD